MRRKFLMSPPAIGVVADGMKQQHCKYSNKFR